MFRAFDSPDAKIVNEALYSEAPTSHGNVNGLCLTELKKLDSKVMLTKDLVPLLSNL